MPSPRGTVGDRKIDHNRTAASRAALLNPPCPHDKTKPEKREGKVVQVCVHCKKPVQVRDRAAIEAEIDALDADHAAKRKLLTDEIDALPKRGPGRPSNAGGEA